jgi:hypothetical protein
LHEPVESAEGRDVGGQQVVLHHAPDTPPGTVRRWYRRARRAVPVDGWGYRAA